MKKLDDGGMRDRLTPEACLAGATAAAQAFAAQFPEMMASIDQDPQGAAIALALMLAIHVESEALAVGQDPNVRLAAFLNWFLEARNSAFLVGDFEGDPAAWTN